MPGAHARGVQEAHHAAAGAACMSRLMGEVWGGYTYVIYYIYRTYNLQSLVQNLFCSLERKTSIASLQPLRRNKYLEKCHQRAERAVGE